MVSFFLCGDLSWKFKTKQLLIEYGHGKIVNECKCSCSAGVESVDGITVLGKFYKINLRLDRLVRLETRVI